MEIFLHILQILGAVSLFIFAIKFLSENLQALSSSNFKRILNQITYNNISSIISGTLFTTTIQSSSAASVFILGFINAGLINLKKAFGLILGANIGTTLTLIFVYLGMKFNFLVIALPLLFITFPLYLSSKRKTRKLGGIFIGLSLLFISIHFLKDLLPQFTSQSIQDFIIDLKNFGILTKLIFISLGILLTVVVHFSSAAITITILLTEKGLPIELGAMLVLGANIGTTLTAHLVALIGNYQTKIVAAFHTLFNIVCAIVFLFLYQFLLDTIQKFTSNVGLTLIIFDISANIIGVLLFLPFINKIVEFCNKNITPKIEKDLKNIKLFSIPFGNTSDIYRFEANKKLIRLASTTRQITHTLGRMITESDEDKMTVFRERIFQLEKEGDYLEIEVKEFLKQINSLDFPNENPLDYHQLITLCQHLESVGDIAIKIASIHRKRRITNSYFTPKMREYLFDLQNNLDQATTVLNQNLNENNQQISLKEAENIEHSINSIYKEAELQLIKIIEKDKIATLSALYYKELIQHYEQLGDHIYRANQAIVKLNEH